MVARLVELNVLHSYGFQHIPQRILKPTPMVAHSWVFVFGVTVQRKQGHKGLYWFFFNHTVVNVSKYLVHAGQL